MPVDLPPTTTLEQMVTAGLSPLRLRALTRPAFPSDAPIAADRPLRFAGHHTRGGSADEPRLFSPRRRHHGARTDDPNRYRRVRPGRHVRALGGPR